MSSNLRFEADTPANPNLKKAYENQVERIKHDEKMADREKVVRLEKNVNLRGQWNENLESASWSKRLRNDHEIVKAEIRMCSKAALAMRRVALKQLFEKEFEMYEKELSMVGKTFYKQRI